MLATSSRVTLTGLAATALSLVLTVSLSMADPGGIAMPSRDVTPNCPASVSAGSTQPKPGAVARRRKHRRGRVPRLFEDPITLDLQRES